MNNPPQMSPDPLYIVLIRFFSLWSFPNESNVYFKWKKTCSTVDWMAVGQSWTSRTDWKHFFPFGGQKWNLMVSRGPNTSSVVFNTLCIYFYPWQATSQESDPSTVALPETSCNCSPPQPLDSLASPVLAHEVSLLFKPKLKGDSIFHLHLSGGHKRDYKSMLMLLIGNFLLTHSP